MKLLSERLKWAMEQKSKRDGVEVIPADIARAANASDTSVSFWLSDANGISAGKARLIASYLGVNALWIENGSGDPLTGIQGKSNVAQGPDMVGNVPVISWVAAGAWSVVSDPYEPGVASEWMSCPKRHSPHTFALRVRGVSMENPGGKYSYPDGAVIFVDPDQRPENGSRVIVRLDDSKEATFKQLVMEGDKKYLKALNPAWPEKIIEINGNATICGVVIGTWIDDF